MAHFYASISGNRGEATRLGTKNSGITAHPRGWNSGVRVEGWHDEKNERDEFSIYATSGSNGHGRSVLLGTLFRHGDEMVFNPSESVSSENGDGITWPA